MYMQVLIVLCIHSVYSFKGLKPSDVISFFDEVNGQVERIKKSFNTSDCAPQVTVSYLGC